MKKHLVAVAVATAFAGPAMAQATLSGVLDFGHSNTKQTVGTVTTKTSESAGEGFNAWTTSRINFAATEDLGGGLKAGAQIQMGILAGGAVTGTRDTFLTLSGGFGAASIGTRETAMNTAADRFLLSGTTNGAGTLSSTGHDVMAGTAGAPNATEATNRRGNFTRQKGLQFQTPSFNGFQATVDYANDSSEVSTVAGKAGASMTALTLGYNAGPLSFVVSSGEVKTRRAVAGVAGRAFFFNSTSNGSGTQTTPATTTLGAALSAADIATHATSVVGVMPTTTTGNLTVLGVVTSAGVAAINEEFKAKTMLLGASYNLGVAEVKVAHITRKDSNSVTGVTNSDLKATTVGVSVPLGAVRLFASAYDGKDARSTGATDDVTLDGNQFGLTYSMSKRTMLYGYVGKNDKKVSTGGAIEQKNEGTFFGMTHSF